MKDIRPTSEIEKLILVSINARFFLHCHIQILKNVSLLITYIESIYAFVFIILVQAYLQLF